MATKVDLDASEPVVRVRDSMDIRVQSIMPHDSSTMPGMVRTAKHILRVVKLIWSCNLNAVLVKLLIYQIFITKRYPNLLQED